TVSATDTESSVAETRCGLDPLSAPSSLEDLAAECAYAGAGAEVTGDGQHVLYAASKDTAGNKETPIAVSFKIDRTAPTITCDDTPTFALDGSGAAVSATVADVTSGSVASAVSGSADVSSTGQKSLLLTGEDNAGNANQISCPYVVAAPPSASVVSPANGATFDLNQVVAASYSCTESTFGPGLAVNDGCAGPVASGQPIDTSTAGSHLFTVTATSDDGQHASETASYTVRPAPPTISCDAPPSTWSASNITIACTATDSESVLANPQDASFSLATSVAPSQETGAASTDSREVCNQAGVCALAGPYTGLKVDRANPTVSIASPLNSPSVVQDQTLTAQFSCADEGSGIASCAGSTAAGQSLDTSTPGAHTLTVTATDSAGNTTTVSAGYFVVADTVAPSVFCGASDGIWHAANQSVQCSAADLGSGLADPADVSFSLSTTVAAGMQTANASTGTHQVCDRAGNCATAGPIGGFKVDRAAPTISITSPTGNPTVVRHKSLKAQFSCADAGSGLASCTGSTANEKKLDTSTPGTYALTVTAIDNVGNAATVSASYTVTEH
ncbi:MAG TPA: hypothetical protein VID70_00080, partial [Solirubrobacteraceae bacterium]